MGDYIMYADDNDMPAMTNLEAVETVALLRRQRDAGRKMLCEAMKRRFMFMTNEVITEREAFAEIERRQITIHYWLTPKEKWTANCRMPVWVEVSGPTARTAVARLLAAIGRATHSNRKRIAQFMQRPGYQSGMAGLEEMN